MHSLLKTTVAEPVAKHENSSKKIAAKPELAEKCRQRLRSMHINSFDHQRGGLNSPIKFIDRDSIEYAMVLAAENDQSEAGMATLTLDNAMALLDPVWGGVYQYSTAFCWEQPHHRKTMANQAGHLRLYALAYAQFKQDRYLAVSQSICKYLDRFLTSDEHTFYCGQSDSIPGMDARLYFSLADKERQRFDIPEIDKRILTRENGWAIEALATLYEYTGDNSSLLAALRACKAMTKQCRLLDGGWLPGVMAERSTNLADTLAMGRAMLQLYRVTFENEFLYNACRSLDYINRHFRHSSAGYLGSARSTGKELPRQLDENISLARFANLVFHYTGEQRFREMALHVFRYLSIFEIATSRMEEAGILLLERELQSTPITFYIETCQGIHEPSPFLDRAFRHPGWYKRIILSPGETERVSVEIDGLRSRPVYTTERLDDLLQHC